jgi:hypothetical protein
VASRVIEPTRDGRFELRLSGAERHLLRELPGELRALLRSASDDPSLRRLFPPAYGEDPGAESEYRELMHGELLEKHHEALAVLERTAENESLHAAEVDAWLSALNDLRLVLGTRLGVTEDLYEGNVDPDDAQLAVFLYLTWLQEQFVEAAGENLPATSD